ncbi:MAG: hypothetical protein D6689_06760 [Deltaproteobacteria bacterium]|nr:MAG: hypothetical protein D6689_06760 [Deltaproteobacteria bacterium]
MRCGRAPNLASQLATSRARPYATATQSAPVRPVARGAAATGRGPSPAGLAARRYGVRGVA